jgi:phosphohistidine phosphatase
MTTATPGWENRPVSDDVRRLVVIRHAKAEAVAASDHARRLTDRGRRDAADAGTWARSAGMVPDHAFVSTAARAHETWTAFAAAAGTDLAPDLDAGLYSAGPDTAIAVLRGAPAGVRTVALVGHNPTMAHLVHLLDDGGADPVAFAGISADFPTCAVAVLHVPGEWAELEFGGARIADFHVGRG